MPGPLCVDELGTDWLDAGTLARTRHTSPSVRGDLRPRMSRRASLGFTVAYADAEGSFARAAATWQAEQPDTRFISHRFKTIGDLVYIFKLLNQQAKDLNDCYCRGALFLHSSQPQQSEDGETGGIHAASFRPTTLAEGRYAEEVLRPQGLLVSTAHLTLLKSLQPLRWARGATLNVVGCLSGGSPGSDESVAQVLAGSQKVRSVGETGKAYFSSEPDRYVAITQGVRKVYLRAFHMKRNLVIGVLDGNLDGLLSPGAPMPRRTFEPR